MCLYPGRFYIRDSGTRSFVTAMFLYPGSLCIASRIPCLIPGNFVFIPGILVNFVPNPGVLYREPLSPGSGVERKQVGVEESRFTTCGTKNGGRRKSEDRPRRRKSEDNLQPPHATPMGVGRHPTSCPHEGCTLSHPKCRPKVVGCLTMKVVSP